MYQLQLTPQQSAHIEDLIRAFPGELPDNFQWHAPFVLKHKALPLYVGWTETTGLRADGNVVVWSTEDEYDGLKAVQDKVLLRASLMAGVRRYPSCGFLIPERPSNAIDCDACNGTGAIQIPGLSKILCQCGGVGWLDVEHQPASLQARNGTK